jgi:hypothetical protein
MTLRASVHLLTLEPPPRRRRQALRCFKASLAHTACAALPWPEQPLTQRASLLRSPIEAQQQQQRAERVKDAVSERLYFSAAAAKYREALQHPLSDEDKAEAAMGLVRVSPCPSGMWRVSSA